GRHPKRGRPGRPAGGATYGVRVRDQSQDRAGARPRCAADATCPRRRGDRMMRRRAFLTALGGAGAAWPLTARAQQTGKVLRIGFLFTGSLESPEGRLSIDALRQGLHQHGYIEGQNIVVEYRAAEGRFDRLPALASELVEL